MDGQATAEPKPRSAPDLRLIADRIDSLVREIGELADPRARENAAELVQLLMDLYGAGLERILAVAGEGPRGGGGVVDALCDDPLVSSLLVLHGLHPVGLETRVRRGIERVQAALDPRRITLVITSATEVEVRIVVESPGAAHACGSTAAALQPAIERALADAAPEVRRVVVEPAPAAAAILQIQGLKRAGEP